MQKFLAAGVLAIALIASSHQTADAWHHFKFGIGLNIECSGGNNDYLCGLFRSGPGPDCYGGGMGGMGMGMMMPNLPQPFVYGMPTLDQGHHGHHGLFHHHAAVPAVSPYQLMSYPGGYGYPGYGFSFGQ